MYKSNFTSKIFIPALSLALEYNGEYHYHTVLVYPQQSSTLLSRHDEVESVRPRDQLKKTICLSHGITLVIIPYWWNKSIHSVAHTIHQARPDIQLPSAFLMTGEPISEFSSMLSEQRKG